MKAAGTTLVSIFCACILSMNTFLMVSVGTLQAAPAIGPLKVHPSNPRYFTDGSGRAVYLTGSHTWSNFKDMGPADPPPLFDYAAYLDFLLYYKHNFIRLWTWELPKYDCGLGVWHVSPFPWPRLGPGAASDGKPKFDLTKLDQAYFDRLRSRIVAAHDRGIYVSVMLFTGVHLCRLPDDGFPFDGGNNVNGVSAAGATARTLQNPTVTALQEAYVRKVIDTVNDLDNVLYEIANEAHSESVDWQYHMTNFIHEYERSKPKQHSVVMTVAYPDGNNTVLFNSPAEAISPNSNGGYRDNPPTADGSKVIFSDTDHLWGGGGDQGWVWKSFLRGLNPIFMDPIDDPRWESARRAMGHTLTYAQRMGLVSMAPRNDLASTTYCLAHPGVEYLVYLPLDPHWIESWMGSARFFWRFSPLFSKFSMWFRGLFRRTATVDLSAASGALSVEWFNPSTGETTAAGTITGGANQDFTAPFRGDAVLYVHRGDL